MPEAKPLTIDGLALRIGRYEARTNRRFKELEALIKANGLNGAAVVLHRLSVLAESADDLAQMARAHREDAEVAKARLVVQGAADRARQRNQDALDAKWLYRMATRTQHLVSESGSKLYWAVIGGAGYYVVVQSPLPAAITHVARQLAHH